MPQERRSKRSDNSYKALALQLNATADRAHFSSLVLTEEQGLVVAVTGNHTESEEIASLSPQLAPGKRFWQGRIRSKGGHNKLVTVAPLDTDMGQLYLCAVGGISANINSELLLSGRGINRILA